MLFRCGVRAALNLQFLTHAGEKSRVSIKKQSIGGARTSA
jgi:hypothetical protein